MSPSAAAAKRTSGRATTGGGNPQPVDGAPAAEPEVGPSTSSGASIVAFTPHPTPKPEVVETAPPEPKRPEPLSRLGQHLSPSSVARAIREGYAAHSVALLQGALTRAGHDPRGHGSDYDGLAGPRTRAALAAFNESRGIDDPGDAPSADLLAESLYSLGFDI